MQISYFFFLPVLIDALSDTDWKLSGDAALSTVQRDFQDSSFDASAIEPVNPSDPSASFELNSMSDVNLFAGPPPEVDGSDILPITPNLKDDNLTPSPEGSISAFETAFVSDKDPDSAKPPCTSPSMAACCVKSSLFSSCVWWGFDRIFCEESDNYACCESIEDYVGSNCEHVGEEGKDWDWLEDILRTPIIIQPLSNPLEYFPRIPWIPDGL